MPLLAAYNFDEASGDALDHSGNARHWTLNTGAQRTTGDSGHTDEGLTKLGAGMATVATPAFGQTSSRTFMFWLKGQGNAVWWLRFYIAAADTGAWGLYLLGGNLTLRLRKGGANTNTSVAWTDDGLWHHYAGTYDGTNGRLYKDGVLVATSAAVTAPIDAADSIQVLETSLTTQTMDDLRVYDEALSQSAIATLMDTPVGAAPPEASGMVTLSAVADLSLAATKATSGNVALEAGATLAVDGTRDSAAVTVLAVVGGMTLSGTSSRAGTVTLPASISLTAQPAAAAPETPPERTVVAPAESRVYSVPAESRTVEA